MPGPPSQPKFNPAYSTIREIRLGKLAINKQNTQCRFERLEMVESINEVLPSGSLVVTDLKDIVSYIGSNTIESIEIEFFNGNIIFGDITSVSYVGNAASNNETKAVAINFSNSYYKYFSNNSLIDLMAYKQPTVFSINELVSLISSWVFGANTNVLNTGYQDFASNFFLYRPNIPYMSGDETQPGNVLEFMKYLTNSSVDQYGEPNFFFWTSFGGAVNFKSFKRSPQLDCSYTTIQKDYRNISVYNSESVTQRLSDGNVYRKAYFASTNPSYQWISKNYYYIRKTPKYLDVLPAIEVDPTLTGTALNEAVAEATLQRSNQGTKNLMFHFQDDGQKYNIDVVTVDGRGTIAPKGGDHIPYNKDWGYFDGKVSTNQQSVTNLLSNQYGTDLNYAALNLMGNQDYMPFLDSPDMWKNMFDLTPIHPHYPDEANLTATSPSTCSPAAGSVGIRGSDTRLQQVMNVRYSSFLDSISASSSEKLSKIREIETQNFVLYSLCCMGKKEDCFFAVLQKYEPDSAYYSSSGITGNTGSSGGSGGSGGSGSTSSSGLTLPMGARMYRYKWNKINFNPGTTGTGGGNTGGSSGSSGSTGSTNSFDVHQLEKWSLDPTIKSNDTQDHTWAINLNERGLSGNVLPPGWVVSSTGNFKYRPIGASGSSSFNSSGDIFHIARVCVETVDGNNQLAYFWAENTVDGDC